MNRNTKNKKNQVITLDPAWNLYSKEKKDEIIAAISSGLKASTWQNLETNGKFSKNEKISFIDDDTLIVGCDIGSNMHFMRAIDSRGIELSTGAFSFSNTSEGFETAKAWAVELAARNGKHKLVLGLEPTGHYWFCLAEWMVRNGISVVQVNPFAVKQIKEVGDNSQDKNDRKDPKLIANLVKDGNFGMPYLPEGVYAEIRTYAMLRDQLTERRIASINRLHRLMAIHFPEYMDAFGDLDRAFTLEVLKKAPFPGDILDTGADGLRKIWKDAGLRGRGYSRAATIISTAEKSVGLKQGLCGARDSVTVFAEDVLELNSKIDRVEAKLNEQWRKIPNAENVLAIRGIGENILGGILSEMGDVSRFDDVKEIQKLSGLGLVACSSGKHKGETKISHRGRKRLRYWLYQAARSAIIYADEFKEIHAYYTTRPNNPLKKMQSLIAIACKILRVIFTILRDGKEYDPEKMLSDIKRKQAGETPAA
jgi:transposase